jgi:glycosyltransferase involved in cell wall biosynthesis
MSKLVSIIMPVYNGEKYFELALKSALNQDYEQLEIIVVDDGSHDINYVNKICTRQRDSRIKFFRKENGGVGSALNYAINKSSGKYISWLSHDDTYETNKISAQVKYIESINETRCAIYSSYKVINENNEVSAEVDVESEVKKAVTSLGPLEYGVLHGCSVLMPRELITNLGLFREDLKFVQDYEFWLRCIKKGIKFYLLNEPLVNSRRHKEQNGTKNNTSGENYTLWKDITDYWINEVEIKFENLGTRLELSSRYYRFFQTIHSQVYEVDMSGALENLKRYEKKLLSSQKIEVIIPAKYRFFETERALLSALYQDHKNFVITIVDDNEIKGSSSIYEEFMLRNYNTESVQIIKNTNTPGVSGARNLAIQNSNSDYLCLLDNDDYFKPEKLSEQIRIMLINELDFSWTNYYREDTILSQTYFIDSNIDISQSQNWKQDLLLNFPIHPSTVMVKTDLAKKFLKFPESEGIGEDIFCFFNFFKASNPKIGFVYKALTHVEYTKKSSNERPANQEYFKNKFIKILDKTLNSDLQSLKERNLIDSIVPFGYRTTDRLHICIQPNKKNPFQPALSAIKKLIWFVDLKLGYPRVFRNTFFKFLIKSLRS